MDLRIDFLFHTFRAQLDIGDIQNEWKIAFGQYALYRRLMYISVRCAYIFRTNQCGWMCVVGCGTRERHMFLSNDSIYWFTLACNNFTPVPVIHLCQSQCVTNIKHFTALQKMKKCQFTELNSIWEGTERHDHWDDAHLWTTYSSVQCSVCASGGRLLARVCQ